MATDKEKRDFNRRLRRDMLFAVIVWALIVLTVMYPRLYHFIQGILGK